jgi:hypothetical protein
MIIDLISCDASQKSEFVFGDNGPLLIGPSSKTNLKLCESKMLTLFLHEFFVLKKMSHLYIDLHGFS